MLSVSTESPLLAVSTAGNSWRSYIECFHRACPLNSGRREVSIFLPPVQPCPLYFRSGPAPPPPTVSTAGGSCMHRNIIKGQNTTGEGIYRPQATPWYFLLLYIHIYIYFFFSRRWSYRYVFIVRFHSGRDALCLHREPAARCLHRKQLWAVVHRVFFIVHSRPNSSRREVNIYSLSSRRARCIRSGPAPPPCLHSGRLVRT